MKARQIVRHAAEYPPLPFIVTYLIAYIFHRRG